MSEAVRAPDWPDGAYIWRQHWHFHRRLHERYDGMVLGPGQFNDILRQIKAGEAVAFQRDQFAIYVGERIVVVVAYTDRNDLVTVKHLKKRMMRAIAALAFMQDGILTAPTASVP